MVRLLMAGAALLALATAAGAQDSGLQRLLSGKDIPLNMKMKDLGGDWKRVTIAMVGGQAGGMGDMMSQLMQAGMMSEAGKKGGGGPSDALGAMVGMSMLGGMLGGGTDSKQPAYYTTGQVISLGGETFLIAYQYKAEKPNLMQLAMDAEKSGEKEPNWAKMTEAGKMSGESAAELTLINMKSIGSLSGIRTFDLAREIAESQPAGGLMDLFMMGAAGKEKAPMLPATVATPVKKSPAPPAKKSGK